jgi:threonine synthase
MPVGNGTQLLGTARGFQDLKRAGVIDQLPRLIGVQAAACAPLRDIMQNKRCQIKSMTGHTTAEGIAIPRPARGRQIAEAIRSSGGEIITVSEDEIQWGGQELAHHGILAEPTSATVWPALKHIEASLLHKGIIVLSITGSGLKSPGL